MSFNNNLKKYSLLLLVSLIALVFGLWGCSGGGGGGGGGGVNFGHTVTVTITDNTGAAVAGLTIDNISVTTDSGEVTEVTLNGTQVFFTVEGIEIDPAYFTLTIDLAAYYPLIRVYEATVEEVTDASGDDFASVLVAYNEIPEGGGVEDSPPVNHDPETGTTDPIVTDTPVDAGGGFEASGELPAGTVFTTVQGESVNDQIYMKLTYHQGITDQEPFYPGGTYGGDAPDAFGTVSFLTSSTGEPLSTSTNTDVALDLTFGSTATSSGYIEADPVSEIQTTSACIVDVTTREKVEVTGCSYNTETGTYTCANGYYTFNSGESVGTYRIDGGSCP